MSTCRASRESNCREVIFDWFPRYRISDFSLFVQSRPAGDFFEHNISGINSLGNRAQQEVILKVILKKNTRSVLE